MTVHVGDFESSVEVEPAAGGGQGGGASSEGGGGAGSPVPGLGENDLHEKLRRLERDRRRTQAEGYGD